VALLALAADKGSPGVTTAALVLAAVWPRPALLAECDPAGGDIALRLRGPGGTPLSADRGLLSLAVAARRGLAPGELHAHTQQLDGGLEVLPGLATAEQSQGLGDLWRVLARVLAEPADADVLADCGRLGPGSPALPVLAAADLVCLLVRPGVDAVAHLRARLAALAGPLQLGPTTPAAVVLVADARDERAGAEVQAVLDAAGLPGRVAGRLALDPGAAAALRGEWGRRLDRSLLVRSAREVALALAATTAERARRDRAGVG